MWTTQKKTVEELQTQTQANEGNVKVTGKDRQLCKEEYRMQQWL
jgi:hypothetical protein